MALGVQLVAPGVVLAVEAAARRELVLRFGGQLLLRPFQVRDRIVPGRVHHGMLLAALDGAALAFRMPPAGAADVLPPLHGIVERGDAGRGNEHRRARDQFRRGHTRELFRIERPFGDGDVTRLAHEALEIPSVTGASSIQKPATRTMWTGRASGMPQSSHPIQKVPPGTQTMPTGAGPGGGVLSMRGARSSTAAVEACW